MKESDVIITRTGDYWHSVSLGGIEVGHVTHVPRKGARWLWRFRPKGKTLTMDFYGIRSVRCFVAKSYQPKEGP